MGVLISDKITGWRGESRIERTAIKILQTEIFKFRRGLGQRFGWNYRRLLLTAKSGISRRLIF